MTGPPYRPVDAHAIPRFAGIRTFMRLPHVTDLEGVDAAAVGIPFDTGTSYRPGARFGPEAIRSASALLRPFHPVFVIDLVASLSIVDYGDPPVAPGPGPPEIAGFTTAEAVALLRALRGIALAGCDVVEVAPQYDGPGPQTALAAANVLWELLALRASQS